MNENQRNVINGIRSTASITVQEYRETAALPHYRLTLADGRRLNVFPSGVVREHTGD